jgi:TrmH family RNA methyltransferase
MKTITSRQHSIVRAFRELAAAPDPTGARLLLDGVHQIRDAHAAPGVALEIVAVAASRLQSPTEEAAVVGSLQRNGSDVVSVTDQVMDAMSPVRTPSGIVAIAHRTPADPAAICGRENGFVLVAVDVQDPGNLGSLLRAAEAGGATGALVCGSSANPFAWKALRGSMGSALRLPVAHRLPVAKALGFARQFGARTVAAVPHHGAAPDAIDWSGRVALLVGGEGAGLTGDVTAQCDHRVAIPMAPPVESLNVAVAGAILIYAARRQRMPFDNAGGSAEGARHSPTRPAASRSLQRRR